MGTNERSCCGSRVEGDHKEGCYYAVFHDYRMRGPHTSAPEAKFTSADQVDCKICIEWARVSICPDCSGIGKYESRVLLNGRGTYTCPLGHKWQDLNEKPTNKGVPFFRIGNQ